jgi:hypothetical protein
MIIKNNKSQIQYEITAEAWQKLKDMHVAKLYTVIDKSEVNLPMMKLNIPAKITEFQVKRPEKIIISRDEIKQQEPVVTSIFIPDEPTKTKHKNAKK